MQYSRKNGTFAHVWWSRVDLEQALLENDVPNTPKNIEALFDSLSEDELTGVMIQAGWEYIYDIVYNIEWSDNQ